MYFNVPCAPFPLQLREHYDVMSTDSPSKLISLFTWNKVWEAEMFPLINQSNFMVVEEKMNNMTHSFLMEALKVEQLLFL